MAERKVMSNQKKETEQIRLLKFKKLIVIIP